MKYELPCQYCSKVVERNNKVTLPTCFQCKVQRQTLRTNLLYALKHPKKDRKEKKEPKDKSKYTKKYSKKDIRQIERLGGKVVGEKVIYPSFYEPSQ